MTLSDYQRKLFMLKHSKKSLLLAAAMLASSTCLAQETTDTPAKIAAPVTETVTEELTATIVDTADTAETVDSAEEVEAEAEADDKQTFQIVVTGKSKDGDDVKLDGKANHEIRMIEIDDDSVPKNLRLILKNLNELKGKATSKDGEPTIMSFTIDAEGALKGKAANIDQQVEEALQSIEVSIDGAEGQVLRILQDLKPLNGQIQMLNAKSIKLKELTDMMGDMKGTISISSSTSSSSKDGEKPKVATNSQIRIIGPDGKVQEMSFEADGLNQDSLSKAVSEALKKSGKDLPDDVRSRVEAAIERAGKRSIMPFGPTTVIGIDPADTTKAAKAMVFKQQQRVRERNQKLAQQMQQRGEAAKNDSVSKKLDLILDRLEKMQQEIDELKKK